MCVVLLRLLFEICNVIVTCTRYCDHTHQLDVRVTDQKRFAFFIGGPGAARGPYVVQAWFIF